MKYILCYGDSNTWGASPDQLPRFGFDVRWPGILQRKLGQDAHIYENGLCGRTTGFEDHVELGRNGRTGFRYLLEICAPLDLVILMLGSNDCKIRFSNHPAWDSALNIRQLILEAQDIAYGTDCVRPQVLVIAPAILKGDWANSWVGREFNQASTQKSKEFAELYREVADETGAAFLDASDVASPGADSVHLTEQSHLALGHFIADAARRILW